ncbi:class I SAM-dependent methyltransferase [Paenibacillus qinlingensis]|nr:class I SAM-dependent methyltransferase [Paenibacillus qinlingensis]
MEKEVWEKLNLDFHLSYQNSEHNPEDPRWLTRLNYQADVLKELSDLGIIPYEEGEWVDYGCGDGKLADMLTSRGKTTLKYDAYMSSEEYLSNEQLRLKKYDVVINTSVFEHILDFEDFKKIIELLGDRGVLALHTLVAEEIPQDSEWFYLVPVHVSFFTNRSMDILFKKWGFVSSLYHLESRMWFFFKHELNIKTEVLNKYNLHYKVGFMDYWK